MPKKCLYQQKLLTKITYNSSDHTGTGTHRRLFYADQVLSELFRNAADALPNNPKTHENIPRRGGSIRLANAQSQIKIEKGQTTAEESLFVSSVSKELRYSRKVSQTSADPFCGLTVQVRALQKGLHVQV